MTQFSLSWDVQKNICSGLSVLQQNGEFVDMTLAADGHMVRVHQVILALASPYIKELISCANCPHPVIFLNKVSYKTLCSILEYVYTGEVLVSVENLNELMEAGKELHIKGIENILPLKPASEFASNSKQKSQEEDDDVCYFQIESTSSIADDNTKVYQTLAQDSDPEKYTVPDRITKIQEYIESTAEEEAFEETMHEDDDENIMRMETYTEKSDDNIAKEAPREQMVQYTVSNQGSVQMILNRFMYYVKHTNRDQVRQWRCVDYVNKGRCPAYVITKEDIVMKRVSAHTHPFHDKRILKKLRAGAVFSAIKEAEHECSIKKEKPVHKPVEPIEPCEGDATGSV